MPPPKRKAVKHTPVNPQSPKQQRGETGGNTNSDRAWLEAVMEAGEIQAPDESQRPPGFLYDVQYQWKYGIDELNIEFFESFRRGNPERKCTGTAYVRDEVGQYVVDCDWNRLTRPCLAPPGRGTVVCHAHGSRIPVVKAAAERVIAEASEIVALRLIGLTGVKDEIDAIIDHKVRLAAANSVLDRAGIRGGVDVEVTAPGYKKVMDAMFESDPSDGNDEQPAS